MHPRIVPYLNFGIAAMLAISLFILGDVFKPQRKKVNVLPYVFFIIPLIMAFYLPAKDIGSSSMSFGGVKVAGQANSNSGNDASNIDYSDSLSISDDSTGNGPANDNSDNAGSTVDNTSSTNSNQNTGASFTDGDESEDNSLKLQGDTVVMDDNNYFYL